MSQFRADLQDYMNNLSVEGQKKQEDMQSMGQPIVSKTSFEQDLDLFNQDATSSADFGGISQSAQIKAEQAKIDAINRQREQEVRLLEQPQLQELEATQGVDQQATQQTNGAAPMSSQGSVMPRQVSVTQAFGNRNPGVEVFNPEGINTGTDFGVQEGTPLALPPGEWKVEQAYSGARGRGRIGDKTNQGYGNSVLVRNTKTGETMRFSHLQAVNLSPGNVYVGGTVLGKSGATGNVTGPHLDLEYKDSTGKLRDVTRSSYSSALFGGMGGGGVLGSLSGFLNKGIVKTG